MLDANIQDENLLFTTAFTSNNINKDSLKPPDFVVSTSSTIPQSSELECCCRICGSDCNQDNLLDIFGDDGNKLQLHQKILNHLQLKVERDDRLPQKVCNVCIDNLNICHHLVEVSHAADSKLRERFLLSPQEVKDENKAFLCHVCGKHFKQSANLQAHKRTHLTESLKKSHHCTICSKSFGSKFHLSEHMNIHDGKTPYSCQECGKAFHKRAQLRQHLQIHVHDSKKAVCEVCGLCFSRKSNLQIHFKKHAQSRTFDCRLCGQKFPTFSEMLSHRKQHSQEDIKNRLNQNLVANKEIFSTCDICGKILTNKDSLVSHLKQHDGGELSRKHECTCCGKILRSRNSLAYHQRSQHSGERPFHCSFCTEGFMTRKLLEAHENRHTGKKPYTCDICWRGFRSRNNLSQHMLKHTGEKKFECSVCRKRFHRKGALTVHNRKHTGEKPFICDLCGKPFSQKNDMLKHQRSHEETGAHAHPCQLCTSTFTSKKALMKHTDSLHNIIRTPLIIANNLCETQIITEDGIQVMLATVEVLQENNIAAS